jgi:hypothetical protein
MLLQNFKFLLPLYHVSQEQGFAWLAAAHARYSMVPESAALPSFLSRLFAAAGENFAVERERAIFAIHPGGPKIIDSIQELLRLNESQIAHSRTVLFEHGNMSSATLPHIWAKVGDDVAVKSNSLAVEWFVKNTPTDLHRLRYFIKPAELRAMCQKKQLNIRSLQGLALKLNQRAFWKMLVTGRVEDGFTFHFTRNTLTGYVGFAVKQE